MPAGISIRKLNNLSIRTKLVLGQVLLIAMVAIFIYSYYPAQQKEAALSAINSKIYSISNMFSIGVGIGMGETDFVAVSEALEWSNTDSSVVYINVVNNNGQKIASFNSAGNIPEEVNALGTVDKPLEITGIMFYKTPILYQGISFGTMTIGYSLNQLHDSINSLKVTTLYFCLALFATGLFLSIIVSNMISRRIRKLTGTVDAIADGAENLRVDVSGNDEVGRLGIAFNHMLERLDGSRNEIVRNSEQLKKQNDELNQFSYVVSHDLKAPLRAIFKLSEWIEEDLGNTVSEDAKKNMKILRGRVFRLEALINGLLQYSKIGRINVPIERSDVHQILKETIELLNPPAHIKFNIQRNMPVFNTKKLLLQQVFNNLISNAIKYNDKPEGMVDISVNDLGRYYRFVVKDNGIGIDKAYHDKVFEIFQTLQSRDSVEATGVGLAIIKKTVEDMGGEIVLQSEEHHGAEFIFTWPKAA
jgi:signal transduction histidine kinase